MADTVRTLLDETFGASAPARVRVRRVAALVLAGLTQLLDRARVLVVVLPLTFDRSLEYAVTRGWDGYRTAALAGVAVALVFFAWGWLVGRSFQWSLDEFPITTRRFQQNHPAVVGVISTAIDGFPRTVEEYRRLAAGSDHGSYDFGPYSTRRTAAGKVALAVSRGLKTAFVFGTTAHVGMAKVGGFEHRAIRRRTLVVTTEAAVTLGAVAVLVSTLVTHDVLGIAQQVRDVITDRWILLSVSALLIVAAAVDNHVRRRRYVDEELADGDSEWGPT